MEPGARVWAEEVPPTTGRSVFVDEAARLLGVSRRTIYYRIREGRLSTFRTRCGSRRVLVESLERLLREKKEETKETRRAR
jgi:excisionase family DNA binding protein